MMRLIDLLPALIVLAIAAAFLIGFEIKVRAQPKRIELAKLGKQLLARPDVSPPVREHIEFCLDHAFGLRSYLLVTIPVLPFAAFWFVRKYGFEDPIEAMLSGASDETQQLFHKFDRIDTHLFLANNPYLVRFGFFVIALSLMVMWLAIFAWRVVRFMADGIGRFPSNAILFERVLGLAVVGVDERLAGARHRLAAAGGHPLGA